MAHPMVEKLKDAGLRYGDKAAVALTSVLFLVCLGAALNKQSIQITPEQVKKAAEAADVNLNRQQDRDSIIEKLATDGIKPTNFAKEAEESAKVQLVADNFKPNRPWITPEPGAGLIRDTPKLIAATEISAYPGRGGALLYDLDENGHRKPEEAKTDEPKQQTNNRRNRASAMYGRMGGGMGGMGGPGGFRGGRQSQADMERAQKEEAARRQKQISAKLAGRDDPTAKTKEEEEKEKEKQEGAQSNQRFKEITKGLRWIAITGVLDHGKLVANYREALKSSSAGPHYARLELERQVQQEDGSWSKWEKVNADENIKVLDNLPEEDEELTPENVRPANLNDPLPFLKAGLWEKVHIASLVPKEKKEVKAPPTLSGGAGGGMAGRMASMMGSGGMGGGGMQESMMRNMGARQGAMSAMMGSGKMGMMGMMGSGGGGGGDVGNYWKSDEKRIMIRGLDFTAEPDNVYRYRVQIVVFNPNHNRGDVNYGVDTKAKELFGPWSEPTDPITMPNDVTAFAMSPVPPGPKSDAKAWFQVVSFDPKEGHTVTKTYMAGPGEVIGDVSSAGIPTSEGTGATSKRVDFNTHQVVLDTLGGMQPLPAGFVGGGVERPALALLLKPDGSVLARMQVDDVNDEVRKDIDSNYKRELADSNKKRESSMGSGYGSMMGRMMGGGGMGGVSGN